MENYIIPASGLLFLGMIYLTFFRKKKKVKHPIEPMDDKFIGISYIPDLERKNK